MQGKYDEALAEGQKALDLKLTDDYTLNNMGVILEKQGCWTEALTYYHGAVKENPELKFTQKTIIALEAKKKHLEQLLAKHQASHPDQSDSDSAAQLGWMAYQRGFYGQAAYYYRKALSRQMNPPSSLHGLAWLRAVCPEETWRNRYEAVLWAERLLAAFNQTAPAAVFDTLAAAYAEAGRFDKAINMALKAIIKAHEEGNAMLANEIGQRLEFYRAKNPIGKLPGKRLRQRINHRLSQRFLLSVRCSS